MVFYKKNKICQSKSQDGQWWIQRGAEGTFAPHEKKERESEKEGGGGVPSLY
jgi:hypothetical protein